MTNKQIMPNIGWAALALVLLLAVGTGACFHRLKSQFASTHNALQSVKAELERTQMAAQTITGEMAAVRDEAVAARKEIERISLEIARSNLSQLSSAGLDIKHPEVVQIMNRIRELEK